MSTACDDRELSSVLAELKNLCSDPAMRDQLAADPVSFLAKRGLDYKLAGFMDDELISDLLVGVPADAVVACIDSLELLGTGSASGRDATADWLWSKTNVVVTTQAAAVANAAVYHEAAAATMAVVGVTVVRAATAVAVTVSGAQASGTDLRAMICTDYKLSEACLESDAFRVLVEDRSPARAQSLVIRALQDGTVVETSCGEHRRVVQKIKYDGNGQRLQVTAELDGDQVLVTSLTIG